MLQSFVFTALLGGGVTLAQGPATPDDLPGDCNCDGVVNMADVAIVVDGIQTIVRRGNLGVLDGDANRDRVVNFRDLQYVNVHLNTSLPPIPPIPGTNLRIEFGGVVVPAGTAANGDGTTPLTIIDDDTGAVIVNGATLHGWFARRPDGDDVNGDGIPDPMPLVSSTDVSVVLRAMPDGFDAEITLTNNSANVVWPGAIRLNRLLFGQPTPPAVVEARNMWRGGRAEERDGSASEDLLFLKYPGIAYAPVNVVGTDDYVLGWSIQYPVLDYKHLVATWGRRFDTGWTMYFELNPDHAGQNTYREAGNLQPNESRTYVTSLRILKPQATDHGNEWLRTLRPYRRWFRCLYGPVRYTAIPIPVFGPLVAEQSHISPTNTYGFTYPGSRRLDVFGWAGWVNALNDEAAIGWGRTMLWAPTGLYDDNRHNNYPPQFTSQWQAIPLVAAELASGTGLVTYANGGDRTLGLWWGQSVNVADQWDDSQLESFDVTDSSHKATLFNELAGADDVGATEIGLDAFVRMDAWESYFWIQDMQAQYPGMRFITEPLHSDLMHTVAPTFEVISRNFSTGGSPYHFSIGAPIMDFLNPGREFWGRLSEASLHDSYGRAPTEAEVRSVLDGAAALGIVPVYTGNVYSRQPGEHEAAESWLTSVPVDLQ